jgi:hypothetical protein
MIKKEREKNDRELIKYETEKKRMIDWMNEIKTEKCGPENEKWRYNEIKKLLNE